MEETPRSAKMKSNGPTSSAHITSIIQSLQKDMKDATAQMAVVYKQVENGVQTIEQTGRSFTAIVTSTEDVMKQIHEVSSVAEQMAASTEQITATFTLLSDISQNASNETQQAVSLVEEQYASMQEITASANGHYPTIFRRLRTETM